MRSVLLVAILAAGCVAAPAPDAPEGPDAWGGAASLTLVEADLVVGGVHAGGTRDRCLLACEGLVLTSAERLVPHDTERIEVLAEWTGGPEALRFMFDHGASADVVASSIGRGEPAVLALEPGMADAPGQKHTHWWWGFFLPDEAGATPETPVHVAIVAHRAAARVDPPPARDAWADGDAALLVPALPRANTIAFAPGAARCVACEGTWWSSAPGGIVAPDAARVRVAVSWTDDTPRNVGAFVPPETYLDLALVEEGERSRVYETAVDTALADSLDQTKSLWWFFVRHERDAPGLIEGEVTLVAEALR